MIEPPPVSVVIPAHDNGRLLAEALASLAGQSVGPDHFETIVVDDGSTDGTPALVRALALPYRLVLLQNDGRGAAAARNCGARRAGGQILLFLDSDVIAGERLVAEHLRLHQMYGSALIAGRTFGMRDGPSTFYRTMAREVFAHDLGEQEQEIPFHQVISRNLSMSRAAFLDIGGFDESFPRSGFEDVEMAYRAAQRGMRMVYGPQASGVHRHAGTLAETGRHMYAYQISAVLMMHRHPEAAGAFRHLRDKAPIRWGRDDARLVLRKAVRQALSLPAATFALTHVLSVLEACHAPAGVLRPLYWQVLGAYLCRGFREGLRQYGTPF